MTFLLSKLSETLPIGHWKKAPAKVINTNKIDVSKIDKIEFGETDYEGIVKYLSEERDFSKDRVETSLNRLKKSLEKKSQTLEQWFT